jgi:hypothetical protein
MNKVWFSMFEIEGNLSCLADEEWLKAVNEERKKEQLDKVTSEMFEIIMDRLEKEWFNLVCLTLLV